MACSRPSVGHSCISSGKAQRSRWSSRRSWPCAGAARPRPRRGTQSRASVLPRSSRHRLRRPSSCVHRPRRRSWLTHPRPLFLRPTRRQCSRAAVPETMRFATTAARTSAAVEPWLPVVVGVWFSGVLLLLARFAGASWRVRELRLAALQKRPSRDGRRQASVWPSAFASLWHSASSTQLSSTCRASSGRFARSSCFQSPL